MILSTCLNRAVCGLALLTATVTAQFAVAQFPGMPQPKHYPWSDATLSSDVRADLAIKELTLDEKISLLHGQGMPFFSSGPSESNGGAGYSNAIPRLGIPSHSDGRLGLWRHPWRGCRTLLDGAAQQPGCCFRHGIRRLPLITGL
jgi:hypothetical protein